MTCPEATSLGVYVLGALDPVERAEVEEHLDRCPACRDELTELAGLPGLLARVTPEQFEAAAAPTPSVDALLLRARRERRDRRRHALLAAAAAAVLLVGGGVAAFEVVGGGSGPAPIVASATHGSLGAQVALKQRDSGTAVVLRLWGVPADQKCRMVVIGVDGRREVAGSWEAGYDGKAEMTGMTSLASRDVRTVVIESLDGQPLVTVPFRSA